MAVEVEAVAMDKETVAVARVAVVAIVVWVARAVVPVENVYVLDAVLKWRMRWASHATP